MKIDKILVTGRLYQEMSEIISDRIFNKQFRFLPESETGKADYIWADALVAFKPPVNFQFGSLKWVHSLSAGVDSFLSNREWKEDVILTRTTSTFGKKISEYCLSYILADLQLHSLYRNNQKGKRWQQVYPLSLGKTKVVIAGTGIIGGEVAKSIKNFGAAVTGVSLSGDKKHFFDQVITLNQIHEVLPEADWIINTLPLTKNTVNFFTDNIFNQLDNACFINVGRGASVNEKALLLALERNNLRLAVLDVFNQEPLPEKSILWDRTDVIITPHISALTDPIEASEEFFNTLHSIEINKTPLKNQVNITKGY